MQKVVSTRIISVFRRHQVRVLNREKPQISIASLNGKKGPGQLPSSSSGNGRVISVLSFGCITSTRPEFAEFGHSTSGSKLDRLFELQKGHEGFVPVELQFAAERTCSLVRNRPRPYKIRIITAGTM